MSVAGDLEIRESGDKKMDACDDLSEIFGRQAACLATVLHFKKSMSTNEGQGLSDLLGVPWRTLMSLTSNARIVRFIVAKGNIAIKHAEVEGKRGKSDQNRARHMGRIVWETSSTTVKCDHENLDKKMMGLLCQSAL